MILDEEKLFEYIKNLLPKNVSFTEEIADVLDINYDAAYRRIKGKTALTLKESLLLTKHYNFTLGEVFTDKKSNTEKILVEKTHLSMSNNILKLFFEKSKEEAKKILNSNNGQIINFAKDFPFYHSDCCSLKKFRLFVFINTLTKDLELKKTPLSEFNPSEEILEKYEHFLTQYKKVSLVEIWNDNTIDNILNQIQYFYEVGLTTELETRAIAKGLKSSLKGLKEQAKNQKRNLSSNHFYLYHNNVISLLNTILMRSDVEKTVFIPYTNLTYFKVIDQNTTDQIEEHLKTQLEFSNKLSGKVSIERKKFFNSMYQKIDNKMLKIFL